MKRLIRTMGTLAIIVATVMAGAMLGRAGQPATPLTFLEASTTYAQAKGQTAPYALYQGWVTVAKSGGDFTTVTDALNSITDNSTENRYLVWIAPGMYTETVTMKQFVDIEGSGEGNTIISQVGSAGPPTPTPTPVTRGEGNTFTPTPTTPGEDNTFVSQVGSSWLDSGTVVGASNAELRSLTVHNTGGDTYATAIYNNGVSPSLLHVTVAASGGIYNYGVVNYSSSPKMNNVTATASGGFYSYGVYNAASSSPTMNNVTATARIGVFSSASSLTMNNVTAVGFGGDTSYGLYIISSSSATMSNVTAIGSGGDISSYGVYIGASQVVIEGSTIKASGSPNSVGIKNAASTGTYTLKVDNSKISGSTYTILNDAEFTTRIGATQLDGGPVLPNGGTMQCVVSYNGNNEPLDSTCAPKQMQANVVTVAKAGGDFTSITDALNSITTNSTTNRYVIRVAPGAYTETVTMKQFVDIEGSGEDNTIISQVGSSSSNSGTVKGASNAELRSLTVRNTGGNDYATAIYNTGASPSLQHVTASAAGSTANVGVRNVNSSSNMSQVTVTASGGVNTYAVSNLSSSPTLNNVTVTASGGSAFNIGLLNDSSSPIIEVSTIKASGGSNGAGISNTAAAGSHTVKVDNSKISGSTTTIIKHARFTIRVGASQLDGGPVSGTGTITCIASYNGNYQNTNGFNACP